MQNDLDNSRGNSTYRLRCVNDPPIVNSVSDYAAFYGANVAGTDQDPYLYYMIDGTLIELTAGAGSSSNDNFGHNVSYAGDVDNDGYDDLIVGAPYVDYGGNTDCGAAYLFFGKGGWGASDIDAGDADVVIYGASANVHLGWSVSDAGNVNGDSYDDIIIGQPDSTNGNAYIFYGKATASWASSYTTASADVSLTGEASGDKFGFSVSGAGNVDNTNNDDIIVGAPYNDANDKGEAYVYYGDGTISTPDVTMTGIMNNGLFGFSVSNAGDFNNDNYADVIIGEPGNDRAYLYIGGNPMGGGSPGYFVDDMEGGDNGWTSNPSVNAWERGDPTVPDITPNSGSNCWDTDLSASQGDGTWTLTSPTFDLTGATSPYLYFYEFHHTGKGDSITVEIYDGSWNQIWSSAVEETSGWNLVSVDISTYISSSAQIRFNSLEGGGPSSTNWAIDDIEVKEMGATMGADLTLNGETPGDDFGWSVSDAGNVNDATYADVIVGAPSARSRGGAYIFFGEGTIPNFVSAASADVVVLGSNLNDRLGYSVSSAGDMDNDNYDDVVVGAPYNDGAGGSTTNAGAIYVFLGDTSMSSPMTVFWANYTERGEAANDLFGWSVSKAGDVNNDGYDEIIVGAPKNDSASNTDSGKAYVYTYIPEFEEIVVPVGIFIAMVILVGKKSNKRKKKSTE
jgi:hypothetical protein